MTRIVLFFLTNMAILLVAGVVMSLLGLDTQSMSGLLVFCAMFGFGGSFLSLLISKWMAKRSMGCYVITQPENSQEQWLLNTVASQAERARIAMPEVAIFDSADMNAFATGPSRNNALVAVSTGLLHNMNSDEIEAVLAHEVSHIANGDMVTMTLLQGVLNTFVMFAARIIANMVDSLFRGNDDEGEGMGIIAHIVVVIALEVCFGILAALVINYFSRVREFKADEGGAQLSSREKMIAALQRLQNSQESDMPSQMAAFGILGKRSLSELMMTHPPLEKRIDALRQSRNF
ncbi:MAG: protease HtpX [Shewanellaceae bacterium]|nr:protease HtpX [Shewanellaceae bacterium]